MRFSHINNVSIIAVLSLVLCILVYKLDLHLRVQQEAVNVFELVMMTAIIFTALCSLYIVGVVFYKWSKRVFVRK